MPKRPSNLNTLNLALELLKRIPRHGKTSAPELKRQLDDAGLVRELRTIQRQLDELAQHFDIDRDDSSKPYGYQWKKDAKGLCLPTLSEPESLVLGLAEKHLRSLLPASVMSTMESFFSQAKARLDDIKAVGPEQKLLHTKGSQWLRKVRVVATTQPLLPPKIAGGVFAAVSNALYNNQWLDVDYKNAQAKHQQARVMPLGLAHQGPRLYLVCRFDGYDNERCLALHRMLSATARPEKFDAPTDFDLQAFDDDGRFGYGVGKRIKLKLHIGKAAGLHLLESPLSRDQTVLNLDQHYEITATVVESAQLRWWLRGFGKSVQVLAPMGLLDT